jgi:hypothetical protein
MRRFPSELFLQRHFRNSLYQQRLFWRFFWFSGVQPHTPYQPLDVGPWWSFCRSRVPSSTKKHMGYDSKYGGEVHFLMESVKTPPHKQTPPQELLDKVSWDMSRPRLCVCHVILPPIGPVTMFHGSVVTPIPFSHPGSLW